MLTVLEIQTTLVSLWKLQKKISIGITTFTAYRNLIAPPPTHLHLFEKKAMASSIKWDI